MHQQMNAEKIERRFSGLIKLLGILFALNLFFVSIALLGSFKAIGKGYGQELIFDLASNPFIGLFIGILVTSIAQSSSATTSLVVALIAGGTFGSDPETSIRLAIPIIIGANIGTTITNILVSMGSLARKKEFDRAFKAATVHDFFNFLSVIIIFPLQYFTNFLGHASLHMARLFDNVGGVKFASPLKMLIKPQTKAIESLFNQLPFLIEFILNLAFWLAILYAIIIIVKRIVESRPIGLRTLMIAVLLAAAGTLLGMRPSWLFCCEAALFILGLGMLFSALYIFVATMRSMVIERFTVLLDKFVFKTDAHAMTAAALLTAIVQSSSVTTSVVVPLAAAGLLNLRQIYPYMLGANIGTTITAILAALSTKNVPAIAVAFSHTIFNILGISIWYPLRKVPLFLAERVGGYLTKSPVYALLFVGFIFFIIPLILIVSFR